ncbi:MAG: metallophosphoesterase, partial [Planctomycetes bacterium]|nr:metallophosphoesterase [Planctomycetota bacterium]
MTYRLFCLGLVFVLAACSNHGRREASATQALLGGPSAQADGSYAYDLTIVFSNDIHDHIDPVASTGRGGMARHVTAMRLLREQATSRGKEILAINAGDNFEGSLFYETDGGALLFELLEMAGYDVVQVGNHDHQFGVQALFDVLSRAFPGFQQNLDLTWGNVNPSRLSAIGTDPALAMAGFLPAQVAPEIPGAFENAFTDFDQGLTDPALMDAPLANSRLFNQTLFFDRGGLRIGVFGIDTDEILYSAVCGEGELFLDPGGRAENLRFYPPATHRYASDMIDYLSDPDGDAQTDDGADLIIAVTHVGTDVDLQIAQTAMGQSGRRIDVIVGGHSHDRINTDIIVDHGGGVATHVVQAGAHGELLGSIDLSVDPATNTFFFFKQK